MEIFGKIDFIATTRLESIKKYQEQCYQIIMIDGTVPGWEPRQGDLHFDHHRSGGHPIQITEIPQDIGNKLKFPICFVTTQVDADAIVAAAFILLSYYNYVYKSTKEYPCEPNIPYYDRLQAIAWDCDHLYVPEHLLENESNKEIAAQIGMAMKVKSDYAAVNLGLPQNRKEWSIEQKEFHAAESFQTNVWSLFEACIKPGYPFPGENGEAAEYLENLGKLAKLFKHENRIKMIGNKGYVVDTTGMGGNYIDPRSPLRVIKDIEDESTFPVVITQREVWQNNNIIGHKYTLAIIPWRESQFEHIDFCDRLWDELSKKEVEKGGSPEINKWGGRKTIGGSGWNAVSFLSPEEVLQVVSDLI